MAIARRVMLKHNLQGGGRRRFFGIVGSSSLKEQAMSSMAKNLAAVAALAAMVLAFPGTAQAGPTVYTIPNYSFLNWTGSGGFCRHGCFRLTMAKSLPLVFIPTIGLWSMAATAPILPRGIPPRPTSLPPAATMAHCPGPLPEAFASSTPARPLARTSVSSVGLWMVPLAQRFPTPP